MYRNYDFVLLIASESSSILPSISNFQPRHYDFKPLNIGGCGRLWWGLLLYVLKTLRDVGLIPLLVVILLVGWCVKMFRNSVTRSGSY